MAKPTKNHTKLEENEVCFVLLKHSWAWVTTWGVTDVSSDIPLYKTESCFLCRKQLHMEPCFGLRPCALFLLSGLEICFEPIHFMRILWPSICVYMCIISIVFGTLFPWCHWPPPNLIVFLPLLDIYAWMLR